MENKRKRMRIMYLLEIARRAGIETEEKIGDNIRFKSTHDCDITTFWQSQLHMNTATVLENGRLNDFLCLRAMHAIGAIMLNLHHNTQASNPHVGIFNIS
jgi:hypothetical protein